MIKKTFSIIFTIFLIFSLFSCAFSVSAYEPTGFERYEKSGMLVSMDTDEILYENNIDQKVYPASIAKIMTVTLMLESEKYQADAKIAMTKEILDMVLGTDSAVSNLTVGEEISQLDLAYYVLMSSKGDCAYLLAQYFGGTIENFVDMMNKKAVELGLTNTHYSNPVGLHDEETYTTVRDIYTLTKYALKNDTFREISEANKYNVPATNKSGERTISTTNFLHDPNTNYYYQYASGVKTGYTDEAGRCLVSTASYNEYSYMCILMNCPPKAAQRVEFLESADLYRWAFKNFSFKKVANSEEPVCESGVNLSFDSDFVPVYFEKPFVTILPNEADDSTVVVKTHLKSQSVNAPVKKGDILGTADIMYAEKKIGTVNLVAGKDIKVSQMLVIISKIKSVFSSIYMKVLYAFIGIAIFVFIMMIVKLNIARIKKRKVKYVPYKNKKGDDDDEN